MELGVDELKVRNKMMYEKLLVGLIDEEDEFLSLGIIEEIDFDSLKARIWHKLNINEVKSIQFGSLRVFRDGAELGKTNII